ncbi:hypothetical protein [Neobacillus sp. PS3-40]|uniref:hypothetical protein n=1 Tax=Neobacillus sp. PS3-40 TaxID=3070679 RepID=UPI0027DFD1CD|nr:hypothetical protein [Neobacillus sp. PS3-40]WML46062.1 hypothetical protein RCG20_09320 [Neobacillus sp. PS3-40]
MACHDGTTATRVETGETMRIASKVDNMDVSTSSKHDEFLDSKHLANQGSCSSCHDPHLLWTKDNPNMLKDHFVLIIRALRALPKTQPKLIEIIRYVKIAMMIKLECMRILLE